MAAWSSQRIRRAEIGIHHNGAGPPRARNRRSALPDFSSVEKLVASPASLRLIRGVIPSMLRGFLNFPFHFPTEYVNLPRIGRDFSELITHAALEQFRLRS